MPHKCGGATMGPCRRSICLAEPYYGSHDARQRGHRAYLSRSMGYRAICYCEKCAPVWADTIVNTPSARAKNVRDDLLVVIFELCSSQYEGCIVVSYQSLPYMAVEIVKAGTNYARQLVKLLNHPRLELRRAALHSIHFVSEGSNANYEVLLSVEAFEELTLALQMHPQDRINSTSKILNRLAPLLSKSSDACARLLQLPEYVLYSDFHHTTY